MSAPSIARGHELAPGYAGLELISHGLRLDTWDAWSEERRCRCVVKVVRPDRAHERHVRDALLTEGRILRELAHPHLVRCYEVVDGPTPAVVLETLTGRTLDAIVDDRALRPDDTVELGLQLSSALGYLHAHGWLHLDLKPDNVVVQGGRAVLIDLSLARRPGDGPAGAGTVEYLAPEQHTGRGLSSATDVWGLGQILVESLTRDVAPAGWVDGPRLPRAGLSRRRRPLDPAYRALLQACLAADPDDRPALDDVRRVLVGLSATTGVRASGVGG